MNPKQKKHDNLLNKNKLVRSFWADINKEFIPVDSKLAIASIETVYESLENFDDSQGHFLSSFMASSSLGLD